MANLRHSVNNITRVPGWPPPGLVRRGGGWRSPPRYIGFSRTPGDATTRESPLGEAREEGAGLSREEVFDILPGYVGSCLHNHFFKPTKHDSLNA